MTWEIVVGIIALAGFVGSIAAWVSKLYKTLGILENTIKTLTKVLDAMKTNSHATHKELFRKYTDHEHVLADHEGRLKYLEQRKTGG